MFIQLHALTDNTSIWIDPKKVMVVTFGQGVTDIMLEGNLALRVIESEREFRELVDQVTEYDALAVLQAYTDPDA